MCVPQLRRLGKLDFGGRPRARSRGSALLHAFEDHYDALADGDSCRCGFLDADDGIGDLRHSYISSSGQVGPASLSSEELWRRACSGTPLLPLSCVIRYRASSAAANPASDSAKPQTPGAHHSATPPARCRGRRRMSPSSNHSSPGAATVDRPHGRPRDDDQHECAESEGDPQRGEGTAKPGPSMRRPGVRQRVTR